MDGAVITDLEGAERLAPAWDALAVRAGRPYAAPAWQLGWWSAVAPPRSRPLVLVARRSGIPAGVLALYEQTTRSLVRRLRVMAAPLAQGAGPVALPEDEEEVARCFAGLLAGLRPRPSTLELEGVFDGRRWARLLTEAWPGASRPTWHFDKEVVAPVVTLPPGASDADDWLKARSSNFRQQMRRSRRALEEAGAGFWRDTAPEDVRAALPDLLRLHHARWDPRGGSRAVDADTEPALAEAARRFAGSGRIDVERITLDGRTISAHLFVHAGADSVYWLGGFDDAQDRLRPGLVALVAATGHAIERGASVMDLGPGRPAYKLRFADAERVLDWGQLHLPGPQRRLIGLQLAPGRLARAMAARR